MDSGSSSLIPPETLRRGAWPSSSGRDHVAANSKGDEKIMTMWELQAHSFINSDKKFLGVISENSFIRQCTNTATSLTNHIVPRLQHGFDVRKLSDAVPHIKGMRENTVT